MKIESGYQKYQVMNPTTVSPKGQSKQEIATEKKSVDLSFSQTAKNLQKSEKAIESSAMNTDKVAALKAAIKQGTYQVNADDLAKAMLNSEK